MVIKNILFIDMLWVPVTFYTNNLSSTQTGGSIQAFLNNTKETQSQPFLLAIGDSKARITSYLIIVDHKAIPCSARTVEAAVDLLFKIHFVFGLEYCMSLRQFWTFVQTAIYEIDVGVSRESPRVREMRSKLLAPWFASNATNSLQYPN